MGGNKDIYSYIREQLQKGVTVVDIKDAFLERGWKADVIDTYISQVLHGNVARDQSQVVQNTPSNTLQTAGANNDVVSGGLPKAKTLLREAWRIYKNSWKTIVGVIVLPYLITAVLGGTLWFVSMLFMGTALSRSSFSGTSSLLMLGIFLLLSLPLAILQFWGQIALIYAIVFNKEKIGIKGSYKRSFRKIHSYFWILGLSGFMIFGGLLFFVIPGIILSIYFSFGLYVFVLEDIKGLRALIKSGEYVRGNWWKVVGRMAFLFLIWLLVMALVLIVGVVIELAGDSQVVVVLNIVFSFAYQILLSLIIVPVNIIYVFLLYLQLKKIKGNFDFIVSKGRRAKYVLLSLAGVLSILVIPSVLAFANINPVKQMSLARDATRRQTQGSLERMFELYYVENGKYPDTLDELVPEMLNELPKDAKTGEPYYTYQVLDNGKSYQLCVEYELQETECKNPEDRQSGIYDNIYKPTISPYLQYTPSNTNIQ